MPGLEFHVAELEVFGFRTIEAEQTGRLFLVCAPHVLFRGYRIYELGRWNDSRQQHMQRASARDDV